MRDNNPLSFKMTLISASWLITIITIALCYLSTHGEGDSTKGMYLLGGGFSAGCAAIFGLLRKKVL
jgi:hypothetical protein